MVTTIALVCFSHSTTFLPYLTDALVPIAGVLAHFLRHARYTHVPIFASRLRASNLRLHSAPPNPRYFVGAGLAPSRQRAHGGAVPAWASAAGGQAGFAPSSQRASAPWFSTSEAHARWASILTKYPDSRFGKYACSSEAHARWAPTWVGEVLVQHRPRTDGSMNHPIWAGPVGEVRRAGCCPGWRSGRRQKIRTDSSKQSLPSLAAALDGEVDETDGMARLRR
jgi:hypothetical protein